MLLKHPSLPSVCHPTKTPVIVVVGIAENRY